MADLYEILGVSRTASAADIRKAYSVVARERHPDRFTDPAEKAKAQDFFQKATEAFNTLSNDRARSQYDAEISKPKLQTPAEIAADAYARAQKQVEARDLEGALELLRAAVYHAPGEARYHAALGRILVRFPKTAREGVGALEEAARLAPRDAHLHAELALALEAQGLRIRARKAAEAARSLAPDDPQVARVAAQLGLGGGDDEPPEPGGLRGFLRRRS